MNRHQRRRFAGHNEMLALAKKIAERERTWEARWEAFAGCCGEWIKLLGGRTSRATR
jgi:hypothetical protein